MLHGSAHVRCYDVGAVRQSVSLGLPNIVPASILIDKQQNGEDDASRFLISVCPVGLICVPRVANPMPKKASSSACKREEWRTDDCGLFWISTKGMFVEGVHAGLMAFYMRLPSDKTGESPRREVFADLYNANMTLAEATMALDTFYSDGTNACVPIWGSYTFVVAKSKGASVSALESMNASLHALCK
jgi:hypothetical protein